MTTRNEVAERLRMKITTGDNVTLAGMVDDLDEALAAERAAGEREARRATVERIRTRLTVVEFGDGDGYAIDETDAILDEEAAR